MSHVQSPTRNAQRASLSNSAHTIRGTSEVRITTIQKLQSFVELVSLNPDIGRIVEGFTVQLPDAGYPAHALRTALRLIPKVQCLVLSLPAGSPMTLLNGLQYPDLRIFVTNLPHRKVLSFLVAHSSLGSLTLGSCGRSERCPLRGIELRSLTDLHCPSRCFVGIARGSLITASVTLTRLSSMSTLAIQTITSHLHSLIIDYFSTDYDILARVATAIPHLRKLKLNEKAYPGRRYGQLRRPWNDVAAWHADLLRLASLEELMLRTLTRIAGPRGRAEGAIVAAWANGIGRHPVEHPSLSHIALIQRDSTGRIMPQRLSHWYKQGDRWELYSSSALRSDRSFTL